MCSKILTTVFTCDEKRFTTVLTPANQTAVEQSDLLGLESVYGQNEEVDALDQHPEKIGALAVVEQRDQHSARCLHKKNTRTISEKVL